LERLDPDRCDTDEWIPGAEAGLSNVSTLRRECKILVEARNDLVFRSGSILYGSVNHPILTWGEGPLRNWAGIGVSGSASTEFYISGLDMKGSSNDDFVGLVGEIPQSLCRLGRVDRLVFDNNGLSGKFPECFGNLSNLNFASFRRNNLTGSIPVGFASMSNLQWFNVNSNDMSGTIPSGFRNVYGFLAQDNFFNGPLPDIGSESETILVVLRRNEFSGEIPRSYRNLKNVNYFTFSDNDLTWGDDSSWVSDWLSEITFMDTGARARPEFHLSGNRICWPEDFSVSHRPLQEVTTTYSWNVRPPSTDPVTGIKDTASFGVFSLGRQQCDSQRYSQYALPPITGLTRTVSGGNLALDWEAPTDPSSGTAFTPTGYLISIEQAENNAFNEEHERVCPNRPAEFEVESWETNFFWQTAATQATIPLRTSGTSGALACNDRNPLSLDKYVIAVTPYHATAQNGFSNRFYGEGNEASIFGWRAYNVISDGTSAQQMARDLGLNFVGEIYSWDTSTQSWGTHFTRDDNSILNSGTSVMHKIGVFNADNLRFAGLGRVSENMVLTLHQGWNILAPAEQAFDTAPDSIFDETLSDCDNLAGVLAVITYDLRQQDFKILLPCHPDIAPNGYGVMDAVDRYDTMYVFFQSQLAVPITWDTADNSYGPA